MQLGFVGLGKMGLNMVTRLVARRSRDRRVRPQRRTPSARAAAAGARGVAVARRARRGARRRRAPSGSWCRPASRPNRPSPRSATRLSRGDVIIDGGNTNFHDDVRRAEALARQRHSLRRRRHERRHLGPRGRLLPDGRRRRRRVRAARADLPDARAAGRLPARRRPRRRPLREDDSQRHRVRPDAGVRRRLRADARERLPARPRRRSPRSGCTAASSGRGCSSWRRARSPRIRELAGIEGYVEDSGEGRWTLQEGDRARRAAAGADRGALHPLPLARRQSVRASGCSRRCASSSAATR